MQAPKDYVARMDRTFDNLTEAVRSDHSSQIGDLFNTLLIKFASGIAIGCGIAVGLAIARAGVGL